MNNQKDPLQSITLALQPITATLGINTCILGWPDRSQFTVDGKLPIIAIWPVGEKGINVVSREQIHAFVLSTDGKTATVYTEQLRLHYMLQFSLFCKTEADRSNIGWTFKQHFTTLENMLIPIGDLGNDSKGKPVEDCLFHKFIGERDAPSEPGFYQRDMTFEVTARILDATTANIATSIQVTQTTGTDALPSPIGTNVAVDPAGTTTSASAPSIVFNATINGDTTTITEG